MGKIIKTGTMTEKDGIIFIEGMISANFDFVDLFAGPSYPIVINMKKVTLINSIGISLWLKGLEQNPQAQIHIVETSPPIVNRFSTLPELLGDHNQIRLTSLYACYFCEDDDYEEMTLYEDGTHYIWGQGMTQESEMICPHCSEVMEIDEVPEKYFRCLTYSKE